MQYHFDIEDCGSIVAIRPNTPEAKAWLDDNVQAEPWQFFGGALCIDHRMADVILNAIADEF